MSVLICNTKWGGKVSPLIVQPEVTSLFVTLRWVWQELTRWSPAYCISYMWMWVFFIPGPSQQRYVTDSTWVCAHVLTLLRRLRQQHLENSPELGVKHIVFCIKKSTWACFQTHGTIEKCLVKSVTVLITCTCWKICVCSHEESSMLELVPNSTQ